MAIQEDRLGWARLTSGQIKFGSVFSGKKYDRFGKKYSSLARP